MEHKAGRSGEVVNIGGGIGVRVLLIGSRRGAVVHTGEKRGGGSFIGEKGGGGGTGRISCDTE